MVRPHRRITRTTRRDHLNTDTLAIEFDIPIEVEESYIHLAVTQIPQLLLDACLARKHRHPRTLIVKGSDDRRNDARRERTEMRHTQRPQIAGSDTSRLPTPVRIAANAGRTRASSACPAGVSRTTSGGRMNSLIPICCSSRAICWLSAGCATWSRSAARVK